MSKTSGADLDGPWPRRGSPGSPGAPGHEKKHGKEAGDCPGARFGRFGGWKFEKATQNFSENVRKLLVPEPAGNSSKQMFPGLSARVRPQNDVEKGLVPAPGLDSAVFGPSGTEKPGRTDSQKNAPLGDPSLYDFYVVGIIPCAQMGHRSQAAGPYL